MPPAIFHPSRGLPPPVRLPLPYRLQYFSIADNYYATPSYLPSPPQSPLFNAPLLSEVLEIYPEDCQCIGYAPSQGRRCRNRTRADNRAAANRLIATGSTYLEGGKALSDEFFWALAPLILCTRYHQNQATSFVVRWKSKIYAYHARMGIDLGSYDDDNDVDAANDDPYVHVPVQVLQHRQPGQRFSLGGVEHRRPAPRYENTPSSSSVPNPSSAMRGTRMPARTGFGSHPTTLSVQPHRVSRSGALSSFPSSSSPSSSSHQTRVTPTPRATRPVPTSTPRFNPSSEPIPRPPLPDNVSSIPLPSPNRVISTSTQTTTRNGSRTLINHRNASEQQPSSRPPGRGPPSRSPTFAFPPAPSPAPSNSSASSSSAETPHPSPPPRSRNRRPRPSPRTTRKPMDGECAICMLPLLQEQSESDSETGIYSTLNDDDTNTNTIPYENRNQDRQLVWCKAQCGNNLHAHCFGQWEERCQGETTCPFCRVRWVEMEGEDATR